MKRKMKENATNKGENLFSETVSREHEVLKGVRGKQPNAELAGTARASETIGEKEEKLQEKSANYQTVKPDSFEKE